MNMNFLVTISDVCEDLFGVRFLCAFFNPLSDCHLTLFHVCHFEGDPLDYALMDMWKNPEDKVKGRLTAGAKKAIEKSTSLLGNSKISIDQIVTQTTPERYGKVKDIIKEASQGNYDAIILGKRASYTLQWLIERPSDEIAQSIIKDDTLPLPLWVCPKVEESLQNVLVCVDGSENSYRAVDHVGYILSQQEQHGIELFHVKSAIGSAEGEYFSRAIDILHTHNILDERIKTNSSRGFSIASTIMSHATQGGYAAIALGLKGAGNVGIKNWQIAGGTTSKLISSLENIAIWGCP